MFTISKQEALITLYDHSPLTYQGANDYLQLMINQTTDTLSVELETKCKLRFNPDTQRFYLSLYRFDEFCKMYILDNLGLLADYWEYLQEACDFSFEILANKKSSYEEYKASLV